MNCNCRALSARAPCAAVAASVIPNPASVVGLVWMFAHVGWIADDSANASVLEVVSCNAPSASMKKYREAVQVTSFSFWRFEAATIFVRLPSRAAVVSNRSGEVTRDCPKTAVAETRNAVRKRGIRRMTCAEHIFPETSRESVL